MKVLDVRWFCGIANIAIVRCEVPYEGVKYYIGGFEPTDDSDNDAGFVAHWGSHFPNDAGDVLFGVSEEAQNRD